MQQSDVLRLLLLADWPPAGPPSSFSAPQNSLLESNFGLLLSTIQPLFHNSFAWEVFPGPAVSTKASLGPQLSWRASLQLSPHPVVLELKSGKTKVKARV